MTLSSARHRRRVRPSVRHLPFGRADVSDAAAASAVIDVTAAGRRPRDLRHLLQQNPIVAFDRLRPFLLDLRASTNPHRHTHNRNPSLCRSGEARRRRRRRRRHRH